MHVVLFNPEIPQNAGNVARTCVAVGAKLWFVRPLGFKLEDRYLKRAGLDYWPHLDWEAVDDWNHLLARLPGAATAAWRPWLFTKKGERLYTDVTYSTDDVLVFGCETQGLPAWLLDQYPERRLRMPIRPQVRSLNLSNSVAIAVYEALRQQGGLPPDGSSAAT
jgi:tRNA (cytidine/uridine-2'-O-)-methyltransferase